MSVEGQKFYPGEAATPLELLQLANAYRLAAEALRPTVRQGKPLTGAPFRLLAIQAIELYLNALMLKRGYDAAKIRGLQHNLAARTSFAKANGIVLRGKTAEHLFQLSSSREYLTSRYDPRLSSVRSHLNRLEATLKEVAEKVSVIVTQPASPIRKISKQA